MTPRQRAAHRALVSITRYQARHRYRTARELTPTQAEANKFFLMVCTLRRAQERHGAR